MSIKEIFKEFVRYIIVGGAAFIVDAGTIVIFEEIVFKGGNALSILISTAIGFLFGLVFNFLLSIFYVFKDGLSKTKCKMMKSIVVFTLIGIIGLFMTEVGMFYGTTVMEIHYLFVKIAVAGVVLLWNYIARKIFIFR